MAPMIEKEMGEIDWNKSSKDIRNLIRGFNPMPGAYSYAGEERMKIWMANLTDEVNDEATPGDIIVANEKNGLLVKTGDGVLELTEIQMPNQKRMTAKEYLRGHKLDIKNLGGNV